MKHSFLYGTYQAITKRFGILLIVLLLAFGITTKVSSDHYLRRFEATSDYHYKKNFTELLVHTEIIMHQWHNNQMVATRYAAGEFEALNTYFDSLFQEYGAVDPLLLIEKQNLDLYSFQDKILPTGVIQHLQTLGDHMDKPQYAWINNKLWLLYAKNENDCHMILACPIAGNQLAFLKNWGYGKFIQSARITRQDEYKNRYLMDWDYLRMSYLIDPSTSSYLTIEYEIDALGEYFYAGYGIVFAVSLLAYWVLFRNSLKFSFRSAITHMSTFENQVRRIAAGDYSKPMDRSGFTEFAQLEDGINLMSDAIQIRNKKLKQNVRELYDLLIEVLEQKDPYTRGHSERVADYSMQIARRLSLKNLDQIYSTALLHDIGKIAIPEDILRKPDSLTDTEYELIKSHPKKGYHLLLKSSQFEEILDGVLYHHERVDGSGYPYGLKGDEIPIEARIIAVADVYDALTSSRSYRDAMSIDKAIAILNNGKENLFDPEVVDCLLQSIEAAS